MPFTRKRTDVFSAGLAAVSAVVGDGILGRLQDPLPKALADNVTHGLVACLTWISVLSAHENLRGSCIPQIVACGMIASFIDVDHFVAARSWQLSEATLLNHRPILHCTSLIVFIAATFIIIGWVLTVQWLLTLGWIVIAAGISHHVRDATRRGLWLWSDISTPPIPYWIYVMIIFTIPLCLPYIQNMLTLPQRGLFEFDV